MKKSARKVLWKVPVAKYEAQIHLHFYIGLFITGSEHPVVGNSSVTERGDVWSASWRTLPSGVCLITLFTPVHRKLFIQTYRTTNHEKRKANDSLENAPAVRKSLLFKGPRTGSILERWKFFQDWNFGIELCSGLRNIPLADWRTAKGSMITRRPVSAQSSVPLKVKITKERTLPAIK